MYDNVVKSVLTRKLSTILTRVSPRISAGHWPSVKITKPFGIGVRHSQPCLSRGKKLTPRHPVGTASPVTSPPSRFEHKELTLA